MRLPRAHTASAKDVLMAFQASSVIHTKYHQAFSDNIHIENSKT